MNTHPTGQHSCHGRGGGGLRHPLFRRHSHDFLKKMLKNFLYNWIFFRRDNFPCCMESRNKMHFSAFKIFVQCLKFPAMREAAQSSNLHQHILVEKHFYTNCGRVAQAWRYGVGQYIVFYIAAVCLGGGYWEYCHYRNKSKSHLHGMSPKHRIQ